MSGNLSTKPLTTLLCRASYRVVWWWEVCWKWQTNSSNAWWSIWEILMLIIKNIRSNQWGFAISRPRTFFIRIRFVWKTNLPYNRYHVVHIILVILWNMIFGNWRQHLGRRTISLPCSIHSLVDTSVVMMGWFVLKSSRFTGLSILWGKGETKGLCG